MSHLKLTAAARSRGELTLEVSVVTEFTFVFHLQTTVSLKADTDITKDRRDWVKK